jgi:hypothetical protein
MQQRGILVCYIHAGHQLLPFKVVHVPKHVCPVIINTSGIEKSWLDFVHMYFILTRRTKHLYFDQEDQSANLICILTHEKSNREESLKIAESSQLKKRS